MKQFKGLLMKDWTIVKGYVFLALLLNLLIPVGASAVLQIGWFEGILSFSAAMMGLHAIMPLVLLAILLSKDMERPDIFFHSGASIHLLNGAKLVVAIGGTLIAFVFATLIALVSLLFAPGQAGIPEVLASGALYTLNIFLFSLIIVIVFYFFATVFYLIKPRIGAFTYIVTFGLFFVAIDLWTRFQETAFYSRISDFWVVTIADGDGLQVEKSAGSIEFSIDSASSLAVGDWLIHFVLLAALYFLASYWFERKVRD